MAIPGAKAQLRAMVSIPKILKAPWALSAVWGSKEGSASKKVVCMMGLCVVDVLLERGES